MKTYNKIINIKKYTTIIGTPGSLRESLASVSSEFPKSILQVQ